MSAKSFRVAQILLLLVLIGLLAACAELTVECRNGKVYRISTKGGLCRHIDVPNPNTPGRTEIVGGVCNAGKDNKAYVTCGGGCRTVIGSGSCTIVSDAAP